MIRRASAVALAGLLLGAALLGGCSPTTNYEGFQAVDGNPKDVKVGVDDKNTVMEHLGSPSAVAAFDPNTWYYISQITDQVAYHLPQVRRRDITAISFNKGDDKVADVRNFTLKDGKVVPYDKRITPTRGRELSVIEQILGNIGNSNIVPQQDVNPGSQRPH
ncbi:MAG TPA: outer membrane protein assembly factor BamE [Caulobacteraceae bacterium]|jgi:outer membrane protein assembly factor BamE (lipoprotein component of BamABCDE complex)|nr:outer membrane protein assembly factor BamE [Caulobacteraceae bacterium]